MSQDPNQESHHPPYGTVAWYFYEFWPVMIFASLFVLMVSLPLVFSGVLSIQALAIIAAFLVALGLAFTLPKLLGLYILGLTLGVFFLQPQALDKAPFLALFLILVVLSGTLFLPQRRTK